MEKTDIPKFYDPFLDEVRQVTQEDVDRWVLVANCYGMVTQILRALAPAPTGELVDWEARHHQLMKFYDARSTASNQAVMQ